MSALASGLFALAAALVTGLVLAPGRGALRCWLGALLALGLWSLTYVLARLVQAPPVAEAIALFALAGLCQTWMRRLRSPGDASIETPSGGSARASGWIFAGACAVSFVALAEHAFRVVDGGWDAWMIWNSRARFLERLGADLSPMFSPELGAMQFRTHADYPLLLPGLVANAWRLLATERLEVPAALSALLAVLLLGALVALARRLAGARAGWLAGALLVSTPMFVLAGSAQAADLPLAALLLGAAGCVLLGEPARAGLFASLAAWTKNEGLAMVAALGLVLARGDRRGALRFALGAAPALAALGYFKLRFAPANDLVAGVSLARLLDSARALEVLRAIAPQPFFFKTWAAHFMALGAWVALVKLAGKRIAPSGPRRRVLLALALIASADLFAYAVTPHDIAWHVRTSLDRLVFQLWPTVLLLSVVQMELAPQSHSRLYSYRT